MPRRIRRSALRDAVKAVFVQSLRQDWPTQANPPRPPHLRGVPRRIRRHQPAQEPGHARRRRRRPAAAAVAAAAGGGSRGGEPTKRGLEEGEGGPGRGRGYRQARRKVGPERRRHGPAGEAAGGGGAEFGGEDEEGGEAAAGRDVFHARPHAVEVVLREVVRPDLTSGQTTSNQ